MCVSEASRTAERVCERVGQQAERVHERVRQQTSASRVRLSRFGSSPSSSWEILGTGVNVSIRTASGTGGESQSKVHGAGPSIEDQSRVRGTALGTGGSFNQGTAIFEDQSLGSLAIVPNQSANAWFSSALKVSNWRL